MSSPVNETSNSGVQSEREPGTYLLHGYGTDSITEVPVHEYRLNVEGGLDDHMDPQSFTESAAYWLDNKHGTPVTSAGELRVISIGQLSRSVFSWDKRVQPEEINGSKTMLRPENKIGRNRIKGLVQSSLRRAIPEDRYSFNLLDDVVRDEVEFGGEGFDFAAHRKHSLKVQVTADGVVLLHVESGFTLRSTQTLEGLYSEGDDIPEQKVVHDTTKYNESGSGTVKGWSEYNYTDHIDRIGDSIASYHEGTVDEDLRRRYMQENPRLLNVEYGGQSRYQLPQFLKLSPRTEQVENQDYDFHELFTTKRAMKPPTRHEFAKEFIDDLAQLPVFDLSIEPGPTNHGYDFVPIRKNSLRLTFDGGNRARNPKAGLRDYGVYESPGPYRIGFLYPENFEELKSKFLPTLVEGLVEIGAPAGTSAYGYELGNISQYTGVYQDLRDETDMAVALVPNEGETDSFPGVDDPYDELKRTLMRQGIPTQMVQKSTAEDLVKGGAGVTHNTFLNILSGVVAKAGGTPWQVANMPGETDVFMGLDVTRDSKTGQHSGASASVVMRDGTTFAAESSTQQRGEKFLSEHIEQFVRDLVYDIADEQGEQPSRITIFRDGKVHEEVEQIRRGLSNLTAKFDIVGVRKRGQSRISRFNGTSFEIANKGVAFVDEQRGESVLHSFGKPETDDDNNVGTPRTLRLVRHSGPTSVETLTRQAYWLSEVHFGSAARSPRLPVPVEYADLAAEFVREGYVSAGERIKGPAYI